MNKKDKGMEADTTGPLEEDIEENKTDVDHTPATPMEIYQDMRPVKNNKKLPKEMKRNKDGSVTTSDGYTYSSFSKALNSPDDFLEYNKKDTSKKSTTTKKKSGGKVGKKKAGCRKGYGKAMRGY